MAFHGDARALKSIVHMCGTHAAAADDVDAAVTWSPSSDSSLPMCRSKQSEKKHLKCTTANIFTSGIKRGGVGDFVSRSSMRECVAVDWQISHGDAMMIEGFASARWPTPRRAYNGRPRLATPLLPQLCFFFWNKEGLVLNPQKKTALRISESHASCLLQPRGPEEIPPNPAHAWR